MTTTTFYEAYAMREIVTGQAIAKSQWSPRKRAHLAAKWLAGRLELKPTTKLAAAAFGVSVPLVVRALEMVEATSKEAAISSTTGVTKMVLTDDERSVVARALGEAELWTLLELATAS